MKPFKRFLAGALSLAMFFSSADFGVFDLSPLIVHAAETATDVYDAVGSYIHLTDTFDNKLTSLDKNHYDGVASALRDTTSNNHSDLEYGDNGATVATGTTFGQVYNFHQRSIDAAAQFKAGKWLTDTTYEAQSGTPTTESLFMTAGGTQWIVNVAYRYLTTDYVRRYSFNAEGDNYRYMSYGVQEDGWLVDDSVRYQHTETLDTHRSDIAADVTPVHLWPGSYNTNLFSDYNYDIVDGETVTSSVMRGNIAYTWATIGDGANAIASNRRLTEDSYLTWNIEGTGGDLIAANQYVGSGADGETITLQPAVAECVLYKQSLIKILEDLNTTFDNLDDNYRADFGMWDVDREYYNGSFVADKASWMFTYASMLRKSANNPNDGQNWQNPPSGVVNPREPGTTYFAMHPTCVSYWLDQAGLFEQNGIYDNTIQSYYMTPYKLGSLVSGNSKISNFFTKSLLGTMDATSNHDTVSPIALDFFSGDPVNAAYSSGYSDTTKIIAYNASEHVGFHAWPSPVSSSIRYYDYSEAPGISDMSASCDQLHTFNSPTHSLYTFFNDRSGSFWTRDGSLNVIGFSGFDAREMAAFSAPHYVQASSASAAYNISPSILGDSYDVKFELNALEEGTIYTYDLCALASSTGAGNVSGNFSATLCDYYRTLYNVYFLLAPFLVKDDFDTYGFLKEIPGVVLPADWDMHDAWALQNAADYFGFGYHLSDSYSVFSTKSYYYDVIGDQLFVSSPTGINNAVNFTFTFASFPLGGDLDGAMENQESVYWDTMYDKYLQFDSASNSGALLSLTRITDTENGANLTVWSQRAFGNSSLLPKLKYAYSILCMASPYLFTEYNYSVKYTLSSDLSADNRLHETFDWSSKDVDDHAHDYTDESGNVTAWYGANIEDQHHAVCREATAHSQGVWVPTNCARQWEDLIPCPTCGGNGYVSCDAEGYTWRDTNGDGLVDAHQMDHTVSVDCGSGCITDDDVCMPGCTLPDHDHVYETDVCPGGHTVCGACTDATCDGWHNCPYCDGTGQLLCPSCWWCYGDADGDGDDDTDSNGNLIQYSPSYVAYNDANRGAYSPIIPCLENTLNGNISGYIDYCEYSQHSNNPIEEVTYPVGYNDHRHNMNVTYTNSDGSPHILNQETICRCGVDECGACVAAERYVTYSETWNIHYGVYKSVEHNDSFDGMGGFESEWKPEYTTCWDQYNKSMRASYGITQRFNNVKYLDITDYTIWCLDHSETSGLGAILAHPLDVTVESDVISQLGLVIYDNESDTADGNVIQNGYVYGTSNGVLKDYVTNAQGGMQRVANSFNASSDGNVDGTINTVKSYMEYFAADDDYSEIDSVVTDTSPSFTYNNRVADVPGLTHNKGANSRMYAFKLNLGLQAASCSPDYLKFKYLSNGQGGRSSTTFYAFVNQAIANTLFCKQQDNFSGEEAADQIKANSLLAYRGLLGNGDDYEDAALNVEVYDGVVTQFTDAATYASAAVTEDLVRNTYSTPYSNSIIIQGDYLAVQNADGTYTTVVGSMHDSWDDREVTATTDIAGNNDPSITKTFPIDTRLCGGRFTLAAHNAIGNRYLSSAGWIMATYREIASRNNPNSLFADIFGPNTPEDLTNCLFIHTFVGAINDYRSTVFDKAVVDINNLDHDVTNDAVNVSFQGSANYTRGYLSGETCYAVDHKLLRQSFVGNEDAYSGVAGKSILDATVVGDNDFGSTATSHLTVLSADAPVGDGSDTVASANLFSEATNGFNMLYVIDLNDTDDLEYKRLGTSAGINQSSSASENRPKTLSYVGYGADPTQGIGTQDISEDGWGDTQLGYLPGDTTLFKPYTTFVASFTTRSDDDSAVLTDQAGFVFDEGYNPIEHSVTNPSSNIHKSFARFGVTKQEMDTVPMYVDDLMSYSAEGSNVGSNIGSVKFSSMYPFVQGLNLKRTLPNGEYMTGDTDLVYTVAATDSGVTDELRVHAGYTKGNVSVSDRTTNNIIVYNPVTTETATVVKLSDFVPDAVNRGADSLYLSEGIGTVARNTITVNRYAVSLSETGSELIVTNTSYVEGSPATVTVKSKVLKDLSDIDTTAYVYSDYTESSLDNAITDVFADNSMVFAEDGYYNISVKSTNDSYHGQLHAYSGDSLYMDDMWLMYKPVFNAELKFNSFAEAYLNGTSDEVPEDTTNRVPLRADATYTVSVTDSGNQSTSINMTKGATLRLCLPVQSDAGTAMVSETVSITSMLDSDPVTIVRNLSMDTSDGVSHYKYWDIIANEDCSLTGFKITGVSDCYITYDSDLVMLDVVPTPIGSVSAGSVKYFGTSEYMAGNSVFTSSDLWVNNSILDVQGESGISGYNATESIYALVQEVDGTYSWSLTNAAILNPHKVEHTNWRYYVVGTEWTFANGRAITKDDIKDMSSPLHEPDTWLCTPNDYYITVGSMDALANTDNSLGHTYRASNLVAIQLGSSVVLSVYKDSPVAQNILMYRELGLNEGTGELYGMPEEAVPVTSVGYAYNSDGTCTGRTLTFNNIEMQTEHYLTLSFGDSTNVSHTPLSRGIGVLKDCAYDYVWYCFGNLSNNDTVNDANAFAYDIKASNNLTHRYADDSQQWAYDWMEQEKSTVIYDNEVGSNPVSTSMLYLDDEFVIHWNNLANVAGDGGTDFPTYNGKAKLGRGWNNQSDCYNSIAEYDRDAVADLNTNNYTDTTKWIYRKYVTFSVDMYCFSDGGNDFVLQSIDDCRANGTAWDTQVNPTTPAYNSDGSVNNLVFIPAGTEVPLGYYSANSGLADDYGRFVDYGNVNGTTRDPNGSLYCYHFWAPLSVGESYDEVVVNYRVEAINGVGDTVYTGSEIVNAVGGKTNISIGYNSSDKFATQPVDLFLRNFAVVTNMRDDWHEATLYAYNPSVKNNELIITNVTVSESAKNSHVDANNVRINPLVESVTDTVMNGLRYSTSFATNTLSIVGRVGGLTVVDSGDPRWQDTFKVAGDTFAIAPIVKAVTRYSNKGINESNTEGAERLFVQDIIDIRGRYVLDVPNNYNTYIHGNALNTYTTQTFKDTSNALSLPVQTDYNVHATSLNLEGVKLGYELLCSLETTGNYFGSVAKRTSDASEMPSNNNGDYGQTKIQIRPVYFGITESGVIEPADVYMRKGSSYALINAGSPYYSENQANASEPLTSYDSFYYDAPYYVDALYTADYTATIPANTYEADINGDNILDATDSENKTGLDRNMLRRLVTDSEANATLRTLDIGRKFMTTSFIDSYELNGGASIGAISIDNEYSYGNAQMMYLREVNRTFIGGATTALDFKDANIKNTGEVKSFLTDNAEQYAQKWYFGLQLPSNAIFVKHGSTASYDNSKYFKYVICAIEVYAVGEKWVLRYESPVSQADVKVGPNTFGWTSWNKFHETNPYLLPVGYFDLTDNAASDFDTRGAY